MDKKRALTVALSASGGLILLGTGWYFISKYMADKNTECAAGTHKDENGNCVPDVPADTAQAPNQQGNTGVVLSVKQTDIKAGDTVAVNGTNVNVRSSGSTASSVVTKLSTGTQGVVKSGPTSANGYNWFNIAFSNGVTGWMADVYLKKIASAPQNTPAAAVTNPPIITSGYTIGQKIYAYGSGTNVYSSTVIGKNTLVKNFKPYYLIGTFLATNGDLVKLAMPSTNLLGGTTYVTVYALSSQVFATK